MVFYHIYNVFGKPPDNQKYIQTKKKLGNNVVYTTNAGEYYQRVKENKYVIISPNDYKYITDD